MVWAQLSDARLLDASGAVCSVPRAFAASRRRPLMLAIAAAPIVALMLPASHAVAQTAPQAAQASATTAPAPNTKAKAKKKPAAAEANAPKKDPALVQQQIDQGVASLQAGKADLAVQELTTALSGGSLPAPLMAKAYYNRGLAYRKQTKPALAISDLTSALWLKGGLSDAERTDALQNRSAAYRDAGLPDQADADEAGSATAQRTRAVATAGATGTATANRVTETDTSATRTASLPSKPSAGAPRGEATAQPSGSGLGGFFGTLLGSGITQVAATPVPAAKPEPVVSGWSAGTEVKPVTAAASGKIKVAAAPAAAATQAKSSGRFVIQVAQLRSRDEAQTVAAKLKQQLGAELAGREASIDVVNAGGFGTLHRVSFGPFAAASEWRGLCPKLLSAGHDCQPVPQ